MSESKNDYFNSVVKRDLQQTAEQFGNAKNEAEKSFYANNLDVKMSRYSKALNVSETELKDMITGKTKIKVEKEKKKAMAKPTQSANTPKKFVNSDGEATKRYVTSGTYERASKRMTNAMNDWFKNWR